MRTEEQVTTVGTTTTLFCDRCSEKILTRYGSKQCYICGRDVCQTCGLFFDPDCSLDKPDFYHDYPSIVCHVCWDLGEEHRTEIMRIRDEAETLESSEFEAWKAEVFSRRYGSVV